jgi:hypothetical protein
VVEEEEEEEEGEERETYLGVELFRARRPRTEVVIRRFVVFESVPAAVGVAKGKVRQAKNKKK